MKRIVKGKLVDLSNAPSIEMSQEGLREVIEEALQSFDMEGNFELTDELARFATYYYVDLLAEHGINLKYGD